MNLGHLLFGFSGRINRAKYWLANLIYAVASLLMSGMEYATGESAAIKALSGILSFVVFISALAAGTKRLHDRDKSAWYLVLFYLVPGILTVIAILIGVTMEDQLLSAGLLGMIAVGIGIWAFIEMGCLRGTIGINRYGSDPLSNDVPPPTH